MNEDIEYIEPTQEHVGQMVEVEDAGRWVRRKLLAVLPSPQAYRFICESIVDTDEFGKWRFARIPRPLTYAERQARCGLKVGDRVRFVRAWDTEESGTILRFVGSMQGDIGSVCTIKSITNYSMCIGCRGFDYHVPYFVLEKVEDRKAIYDDYGKTVYVDGSPQDEFKLVTTFCEVVTEPHSCTWFGVVRSGDKRFVYELRNLRVKE